LYHNLLAWIDDVLLFAKSIDEYLEKLETFLGLMQTHGLKLNPLKCRLYNTSVKWCGRVISGQGVKHDPARVEALQGIPYPTNAGQLQQFLTPDQAVDESLKGKGRKKRVAAGVLVDLSPDERESYPHEDATMCLLTDASDEGWSIIVTQVHDFNETIPIDEQEHEMLTCQSGLFTGAQQRWSVIEKEAYPIARACSRLNYLLMRPKGFRMYCDHKNLIHVFAPDVEWKAHTRGKLSRWADIISEYRYVIEHIEGERNVWADMMSRWEVEDESIHLPEASPWTTDEPARAHLLRANRQRQPQKSVIPREVLRPVDADDFIWPSMAEILAAQAMTAEKPPGKASGRTQNHPKVDLTKSAFVDALEGAKRHLESLHKEIRDARQKKTWRDIAKQNNRRVDLEVQEGDYVLWSRVDERKYPKLAVTWLGPYRVTEVLDCSCMIEHLLSHEVREAHNSRLKLYAESSYMVDPRTHLRARNDALRQAKLDQFQRQEQEATKHATQLTELLGLKTTFKLEVKADGMRLRDQVKQKDLLLVENHALHNNKYVVADRAKATWGVESASCAC
ncbi:hypothetical protein As57867_002454, partial [Aphanomyces stellatus]